MIASVLTYPHEVLRTRLQMQPRIAAAAKAVAEGTPVAPPPPPPPAAAAPTRPGRPEKAPGRALHTLASTPRVRAGGGASPSRGASRGISHMGNKGNGGRYSGVLQACTTIAREEGIRGFYRGMGVNLVRTVPSSALTILT